MFRFNYFMSFLCHKERNKLHIVELATMLIYNINTKQSCDYQCGRVLLYSYRNLPKKFSSFKQLLGVVFSTICECKL